MSSTALVSNTFLWIKHSGVYTRDKHAGFRVWTWGVIKF